MLITAALFCLASNVFHEARGEPLKGQEAVALVTMNRARTPDNVCKVVYAPGQFSWVHDRRVTPPKPTDPAWIKANEIAANILNGNLPDFTHGATLFHERHLHPYWPAAQHVVTIGNHSFYRSRNRGEY